MINAQINQIIVYSNTYNESTYLLIYLRMFYQTVATNKIDQPISFTYVNKLASWWPPEKIASSLGVP